MSSPTAGYCPRTEMFLKKPIYEFTQHPAIEYALCYAHVPRIHRTLNHTDGSALVCVLACAALALVWFSEGELTFGSLKRDIVIREGQLLL